ncbi:MAG: radical SAM protein, partial [bacterium]
FRDPTFTINRKRTIEICEGIIKNNLKIEFVCETHTKNLDTGLLDIMKKAGLKAVKIGVESANSDILGNFNRQRDAIKHQEEIVSYCESNGISITAFYILGMPEDTEESIRRTIDYAKKLNTTGAQFTIATPYPGTKFYDDLERKGLLITKDYENYDIQTPVFAHPVLSPEKLLELKNYAYQSYYLRPVWIYKFLKLKLFK